MPHMAMVMLLLFTLTSIAQSQPLIPDAPKVLFGELRGTVSSAGSLVDVPLQVLSPVAQIELAPGTIVSAGSGAILAFPRMLGHDGRTVLVVVRGPAFLVNLPLNATHDLLPGSYLLVDAKKRGEVFSQDAESEQWVVPVALHSAPRQGLDPSQGFRLADSVMVRQQIYLDSLRIDVTAINHALASLIRSLFPARR